jgi:hypothetical protein
MRIVALIVALLTVSVASAPSAAPRFAGTIEPVRWDDLRHSYRKGCPVAPAQLRTVVVSFWDFGGKPRTGRIVVARRVAAGVVAVFRRLWQAHFPLRRLQPVSAYRGDDDASMAADNTSGFNCRFVGGTSRWSMHAYGEAIDVNPVENPYVRGSRVEPPAGRAFLDRTRVRPGMATGDGVLVRAFASIGWKWGARFGDYQHFSTTGS